MSAHHQHYDCEKFAPPTLPYHYDYPVSASLPSSSYLPQGSSLRQHLTQDQHAQHQQVHHQSHLHYLAPRQHRPAVWDYGVETPLHYNERGVEYGRESGAAGIGGVEIARGNGHPRRDEGHRNVLNTGPADGGCGIRSGGFAVQRLGGGLQGPAAAILSRKLNGQPDSGHHAAVPISSCYEWGERRTAHPAFMAANQSAGARPYGAENSSYNAAENPSHVPASVGWAPISQERFDHVLHRGGGLTGVRIHDVSQHVPHVSGEDVGTRRLADLDHYQTLGVASAGAARIAKEGDDTFVLQDRDGYQPCEGKNSQENAPSARFSIHSSSPVETATAREACATVNLVSPMSPAPVKGELVSSDGSDVIGDVFGTPDSSPPIRRINPVTERPDCTKDNSRSPRPTDERSEDARPAEIEVCTSEYERRNTERRQRTSSLAVSDKPKQFSRMRSSVARRNASATTSNVELAMSKRQSLRSHAEKQISFFGEGASEEVQSVHPQSRGPSINPRRGSNNPLDVNGVSVPLGATVRAKAAPGRSAAEVRTKRRRPLIRQMTYESDEDFAESSTLFRTSAKGPPPRRRQNQNKSDTDGRGISGKAQRSIKAAKKKPMFVSSTAVDGGLRDGFKTPLSHDLEVQLRTGGQDLMKNSENDSDDDYSPSMNNDRRRRKLKKNKSSTKSSSRGKASSQGSSPTKPCKTRIPRRSRTQADNDFVIDMEEAIKSSPPKVEKGRAVGSIEIGGEDSDDDLTNPSQGGSQTMNICVTAIKERKRKKSVYPDYMRKKMSPDELGTLRLAFVKHYPPPPSNMQAQGRYEHTYGTEMSQEMIRGLWETKLKPWSDKWWEWYMLFNNLAREKKLQKAEHLKPTVTEKEAARWAQDFYDEHGDARPSSPNPSKASLDALSTASSQ